jgi:HSP20 family protein
VPREEQRSLAHRRAFAGGEPFAMLERLADEMDRAFGDFGLGWLRPRSNFWNRRWRGVSGGSSVWNPQIDVVQKKDHLVIRADLPGVKKDDISVHVTDEGLTISGERRYEEEHDEGNTYRSELSYGSFSRFIPLPEGAMADQAKANFKDGVLEITMPAPPEEVRRGRRLEITEGEGTKAEPRKS